MKYMKMVIILSLLIFLGGCSIKISPYSVKLDENKETSIYEKNTISSHAVSIVASDKYKTNNGCIKLHSYWRKYEDKLNHCFVVEDDILKRIDYSECYHSDSKMECFYIGGGTDEYAKYINKLQDSQKIETTYNSEMQKYLVFKNKILSSINNNGPKFLEEEFNHAQEKVKNTHVIFKSPTIQLPKKIHSELLKKVKSNVYISKRRSYFDFSKINLAYNYIYGNTIDKKRFTDKDYIASFINLNYTIPYMSSIERYQISVSNNKILEPYKNVKSNITFDIESLKYDFIPNTYLNSNADISIKFDKKINTFTFVNKTNKFINIADISIYYNNDILSTNINHQLPPIAEKKISGETMTKNINEYIEVLSDNQNILFGIGLKYKINNSEKTLFSAKKYKVNSF